MQNSITGAAATSDSTSGQGPAASAPPSASAPAVVQANLDRDLRLVIEEDQASGSYIYKTVNRITGQVILQLPRDQLLKLHDDEAYVAGQVIRAKA